MNYNPYIYNNGYYPQQNIPQMGGFQQNQIPFVLINGVDEAKRYIPNINSTVYLRDTNSSLLFEKTCDSQGRTIMRTFELKEMNLDQDNKPVAKPEMATKQDLVDLANGIANRFSDLEKLIGGKNE